MNSSWAKLLSAAVLAFALGIAPHAGAQNPASPECDVTAGASAQTSPAPCPANGIQAIINAADPSTQAWCGANSPLHASCVPTYIGARSDAGGAAGPAIDAFGYCRYIDNNGSNSIFVPFNSSPEWTAFLANYPKSYINLALCARPATMVVPDCYCDSTGNCNTSNLPNTNCTAALACDQPLEDSVNLPYYRAGATYAPVPVQFPGCTMNGVSLPQTATVTFTAGDSQDGGGASGWTLSNVAYAGPVYACPAGYYPYDGSGSYWPLSSNGFYGGYLFPNGNQGDTSSYNGPTGPCGEPTYCPATCGPPWILGGCTIEAPSQCNE